MKRIVAALLFLGLLSASMLMTGNAYASISANGLITQDTTWRLSDSPVKFTGHVGVASGVTLTIEPGVTVDLNEYYLQVNGTLKAQGTSSNPITFTTNGVSCSASWQKIDFTYPSTAYNEQTGAGCIIDHAVFERLGVFVRGGCQPRISNCVFNQPWWDAIWTSGGSPTIKGNTFNGGSVTVPAIYGDNAIITDNVINGNGVLSGIELTGKGQVLNNKIINGYSGILASGDITVKNNVVVGCSELGLRVSGASAEGNYIKGCGIGIEAQGSSLVRHNTVTDNTVGIQANGVSAISNNNILGSTQNSIVLLGSGNLDASQNWWGTTDQAAIGQSIRDYKNDFNLGTVTYLPCLSGPDAAAPQSADISIPATPLPTQSPTSTIPPLDGQPIQPTQVPSPIEGSSNDATITLDSMGLVVIGVVALTVAWVVVLVLYTNRKTKKAI
ncbi:MAG: hypothetical protein NWE93_11155 [Candidatus Bathyarchaeota archaeon]|nr:hypothetical protein [Candidatus Bathyarchaeota archaeon]